MNSRQRRHKRRLLKQVLRDHKRGLRGTWHYRRGSIKFEYEVTLWEDWVGIYSIRRQKYGGGLIVAYHIDFPKWVETMNILEPYTERDLQECPAYKLKGTKFLLVPHSSGKGTQWVIKGQWMDGQVRLLDSSFDDAFAAMSDEQKNEAIWHLDVLTGER
jgi:hypothetical protein